jgi:hypothetical protein
VTLIFVDLIRKDGTECKVKCTSKVYEDKIEVGTTITVKHNGVFSKSKQLKQPIFWRYRSDLQWTTE